MSVVKSIARVGYALWDESQTTPGYGAVKVFESDEAGGRNFTATPRGEVTEVSADGKVVIAVDNNDGYDIELELLDIIDDIEADWLGVSVNSTTGAIAEFATGKTMPKLCLILLEDTLEGSKCTYYPMCQVSKRPDKNSKTSEGSFDPQFPTISLAARPNADKLVRYQTAETAIPAAVPTFPATASANEAATVAGQ